MNYTISQCKILGLQRLSLALLITLVTSVSFSIPDAYAYHIITDRPPQDTDIGPQQQPVEEEATESELPWLFAVFAITWAAFFGYVLVMSRRQREMQREIEALSRTLSGKERKEIKDEPTPL